MAKDINSKPYDESTITKLEIFENHLLAWLPVFIQTPYTGQVTICDYCAGSGQDSEGVPGSPLRTIKTINKYRDSILQKDIVINVVFNEALTKKSDELQTIIDKNFDYDSWGKKVKISCYNEDFQELFIKQYRELNKQPNLIFIDQYGVKQINNEIFQKLINLRSTDFLFFMSSSAMKRFSHTPEFKLHFPDIDPNTISEAKYTDIHRIILDYYKAKIPLDNCTKLYPFTLMKGRNIYGLVFGSKHPLGVEKFLDVAWDKNKVNGEANFDIDGDIDKAIPTLFDSLSDYERPITKREVFEEELEKFIISKGQITNRDIYHFTLDRGHPKSHAKECAIKLKKEGKIEYSGNIGFSFASCCKNEPKPIKVKVNG